mgnify:CR=1 FL=1
MFDGLELRCCENLLGIAVAPQIEPKKVSGLVITAAVKQILGLDHHIFEEIRISHGKTAMSTFQLLNNALFNLKNYDGTGNMPQISN